MKNGAEIGVLSFLASQLRLECIKASVLTFKVFLNSGDLCICAIFELFDDFFDRRLAAFQCPRKQVCAGHAKLADDIGDIA